VKHATHAEIGRFIVDELGIFGIFGNRASKTPLAILHAEPRISWIVNNAHVCHANPMCNASNWVNPGVRSRALYSACS